MSAKPRQKGARWEVVFASDRVPQKLRRAMFDDQETALAWAEAVAAAVSAGSAPPEPHVFTDRAVVSNRFPPAMMQRTLILDAARIWHEHKYLTRGDANVGRADAVWADFCKHVLAFFHSTGVYYVQDIRAVHVEQLALALAGRRSPDGRTSAAADVASIQGQRFTARALSELSRRDPRFENVSESTVHRAACDGLLKPVGNGLGGALFTAGDAAAAGVLRPAGMTRGLNQQSASNILWTLRSVMDYARGHGVAGVLEFADSTWRSATVWGKDKARRRRKADRDPSWIELYNVAAELAVVHQFTMWLLALTGVRLGEAFGFHVEDWLDVHDDAWPYGQSPGVGGVLIVERQGGRAFTFRDDFTGEVLAGDEKDPKTTHSLRVVIVPEPLAVLIRLVIRIFHADPDSGRVDPKARLVPVLNSPTGAQSTFSAALKAAVDRAGAPAFTPHTLRGRLVSDLTDLQVEQSVVKRMVGHRPGTDVLAVHYLRDTLELRQLRAATEALTRVVTGQLPDGLMVPTTRRHRLRESAVDSERWAVHDVRLQEAGWHVSETDRTGRYTVAQVAAMTGAGRSTVRRACVNGQIQSENVELDGKLVHLVPAHEVDRLLLQQGGRVTLPVLAERLNIPYLTLWQLAQDIAGVTKAGRELVIGPDAEAELEARAERWIAIRSRSLGINEIALRIGTDRKVAARLMRAHAISTDPDDPSRYVTTSVEQWIAQRRPRTNLRRHNAS